MFSRKVIVLYKFNQPKNRFLKFINKDCTLTVCDFPLLHVIIFKKMVNTFILWILYIKYWGQYKLRMRKKKWNHTKIIWNWPSCKILPPSFALWWNSIPDWEYTIISCFLINSGNVKRVTGLSPVEIYLFKADNNNSKTRYKTCSEF